MGWKWKGAGNSLGVCFPRTFLLPGVWYITAKFEARKIRVQSLFIRLYKYPTPSKYLVPGFRWKEPGERLEREFSKWKTAGCLDLLGS